MQDLRFTEHWLVVDVRAADAAGHLGRRRAGLRPRPGRHLHARHRRPVPVGVPAARRRGRGRPHRPALGRLLQPWTGRPDLAGLDVVRSAVYTFRARLATRFQVGRAFLLGDAAHLTPPFIGQGLAAGHPRRRQPRLEDRPRADRPGRPGPARHLPDRTPPTRRSHDPQGEAGRLGDDRRAGPRRRRPPAPARPPPCAAPRPGSGRLHRDATAARRRAAPHPAAVPPAPAAARRRPDPQPDAVPGRRQAGTPGRRPGRGRPRC